MGAKVYEQMYEFRADMAEVHRRLAYDLDRFWEANDRKLQKLSQLSDCRDGARGRNRVSPRRRNGYPVLSDAYVAEAGKRNAAAAAAGDRPP